MTQSAEAKKAHIAKLNAKQRAAVRAIWGTRTIDTVYVDVEKFGPADVRVRDENALWLTVSVGPRGAIHAKRFLQLA